MYANVTSVPSQYVPVDLHRVNHCVYHQLWKSFCHIAFNFEGLFSKFYYT